jgi:hypothetical protein
MDEIIGQVTGFFVGVRSADLHDRKAKGCQHARHHPWLCHWSISVRDSCSLDLVGKPARQSIAGQN